MANSTAVAMFTLKVRLVNAYLMKASYSHTRLMVLITSSNAPHHQNPSATDLNSTVARLYQLLASDASLGACPPNSLDGSGWVSSSTQLSILSVPTGPGATQHVSACTNEWGANVVAQVITTGR